MMKKKTIKETNHCVCRGHFHLHFLLSSVALKLLTLECQQTALSNSPLSELQFSFLSQSFLLFFRSPFFLMGH